MFTVIIPVHKRPGLLVRLLESIRKSDYHKFVDDIYVVENGSKESNDIAEIFPDLPLNYFYLEEGNKSKALNFVLKKITG